MTAVRRTPRRLALLLIPLVVLAVTAAACGSDAQVGTGRDAVGNGGGRALRRRRGVRRAGRIGFWDNRVTQHAVVGDFAGQHRLIQRITLKGDRPS